jgi:hypothetical protein
MSAATLGSKAVRLMQTAGIRGSAVKQRPQFLRSFPWDRVWLSIGQDLIKLPNVSRRPVIISDHQHPIDRISRIPKQKGAGIPGPPSQVVRGATWLLHTQKSHFKGLKKGQQERCVGRSGDVIPRLL